MPRNSTDCRRALITDVLAATLATTADAADVEGSGLILVGGGQPRAVGGSDATCLSLAHAQVTMGSGPAFRCMVSGHPVGIKDLMTDYPFGHPELAPYSGQVHAVLSVPIRVGRVVAGALDLYDRTPHSWPARQVTVAHELAQVMAAILYLLSADPRGPSVLSPRSGVPQ
ncbi:GAF domain-containing protein [Spirillospora sp. NPDC048911]|uniref:GAF domain-containing protein n=1 Tax=Spirillospora sp. NPDC048911 TaxID=3364527 RepID=UPI0037152A0E